MGKKGNWFSAIKRVFIPNSKDKQVDASKVSFSTQTNKLTPYLTMTYPFLMFSKGLEKKDAKEKKKKVVGKLKHGSSFIPLFKQPSSIEEILGEAEREHHLIDYRPISPYEQPSTRTTPLQDSFSPWTPTPQRTTTTTTPIRNFAPQMVVSPMNGGSTSQRVFLAPKITTPQRTASSSRKEEVSSLNVGGESRSTSSRYVHRPRPEPTLRYQNMCATKIQATYRGYTARRNYRSLRGLVRLQGVLRGQSVKRQTVNAMKCMQLLVRVQSQIQSRRIQMLENQALQRQSISDKLKFTQPSENGYPDEWEDSRLTKQEIEARAQRKYEAMLKRERAMAYAYSHQLWKASPKTMPQAALMDIRSSGGYPWWSNWLDGSAINPTTRTPTPTTKPSECEAIKNIFSTPPRPNTTSPLGLRRNDYLGFEHLGSATPRSTRSVAVPSQARPEKGNNVANSTLSARFKDDDSLTSCPAFSAPRYMEPTASAKAKVKMGLEASPEVKTKRRGSFTLGQGIGSFKWNKRGSLFSATTTPNREKGGAQKMKVMEEKLQSTIGNLSVDSTTSMPAALGRKPFNRYV
ncbi:uncharacterized protein [Phyllobates terribilis]|uniref:uncharacterized protein n=1 Tax=Phyllobates terribilis TaxID=111132 RepID=UPI003CCA99A5